MKIYELTYQKFRQLKTRGAIACQKCGFLFRVGDLIVTKKRNARGAKSFHHADCYTDAQGQPIL